MAAITTYATLVQALRDSAEDDGAEFLSFVPVAIDLAEERLFREFDLQDLETKESGSLVSGTATVTKPTGYSFAQFFYITVSGVRKQLTKRMESFIQDYWPTAADTGEPKYYADASNTEFVLAPTPDSTYAYEVKYLKKPTKLSSSVTTNYYTDNCPDALYYACMAEMARFMKAFSQIEAWEVKFKEARESWNIQAMRKRRDGNETPMSPENSNNTLRHSLETSS